jgi:hypothetical protein
MTAEAATPQTYSGFADLSDLRVGGPQNCFAVGET